MKEGYKGEEAFNQFNHTQQPPKKAGSIGNENKPLDDRLWIPFAN